MVTHFDATDGFVHIHTDLLAVLLERIDEVRDLIVFEIREIHDNPLLDVHTVVELSDPPLAITGQTVFAIPLEQCGRTNR